MFAEDYKEFFDDFSESAIYSYSGTNTAIAVIIDYDIDTFNEYSSEKTIVITLPTEVVAPRRGATVTVGSTVFTLGETINDDGFVVQMEATI